MLHVLRQNRHECQWYDSYCQILRVKYKNYVNYDYNGDT